MNVAEMVERSQGGPHRYNGLGIAVVMTHDQDVVQAAKDKGFRTAPFERARDDTRPWHEISIPCKALDEAEPPSVPAEDLPF